MLAAVAIAQSPDNNSVIGPNKANGGAVAKFRKYKIIKFISIF
jgi:hypothetical protein